MNKFTEIRRQQFLTESHYQDKKKYLEEGIPLYLESDAFEDDEYNCGEARRYLVFTQIYQDLIFLEYTAGQPLDTVSSLFDNVIESYAKRAEAYGIFEKTSNPGVITGQGGFIALQIIGLAVLLNKLDYLPLIVELINGVGGEQSSEDKTINKLLKLIDNHYPDTLTDGVYSYNYIPLRDTITFALNDNKKEAEEMLNDYLADWYSFHKQTLWYNSHLDVENSSYVGYWAFEAAALVYLLDLDDTEFHKYLYYPKDIVKWIRTQNKTNKPEINIHPRSVLAGKTCPRSGYWYTVAKENSRQYFKQGDVFPEVQADWGEVFWQYGGE